ncbi:UDPglucose--hexose-1-phosphate uridylyltransferase [Motilibacter rhizosphaerae]|uniref:Galactose-1-phosphate uridylyltransferase n=1 Tax=Motilibacter rhizosphaerae TaxID=598652 RepID=A0A4Q7NQU0_9ACTN|nr:galactose-1-phosphate uridylyltransferase [Motilibacter rhizosphaerae]RZS87522.1 UDPglucose--hexose-1-phosphate uridylyltransferase [Motilibacter rhizosphaerae]
MKVTSTRMADGRELLYFDERDDAARVLVDRRDLARPEIQSEMRHDPVLDEWVAIAGHRQTRIFQPTGTAAECPLCPTRDDDHLTEIPSSDYDVVVFENRFPSFALDALEPDTDDAAGGLVPRRPAKGRCEVVCFTSDHDSSFRALPSSRVRTVLEAWVQRTTELSGLPEVEQVFAFENRGQEIGVTLSHPHGQIYGYPYVTPKTRRMLESARAHQARTGRNLFADVLAAEVADGRRVVARSAHWTAFVPAAARWPLELHVYPNERVLDLPGLSEEQRADFGPFYLDLLRRVDGLYDTPTPYIAGWHQAPVRTDRDLAYLHLQLLSIRRAPGKLKYLAGSESMMWAFVNDVSPEQAAERMRTVTPVDGPA